MPRFYLKEPNCHLTAMAGLMLIGPCLALAQLERLDARLPRRGKIRLSNLVKSYVGPSTLGKIDPLALLRAGPVAIEALRTDRFLQEALGIGQGSGSVWLQPQSDTHATTLQEHTDEWSVRMIRWNEAPITAQDGFVCLDFDTFVMDNSGTKKQCFGRTHQGVDGYTPIAACPGNDGWCVGLGLTPGTQHRQRPRTDYSLERMRPQLREPVGLDQSESSRSDSGFDSARLLFQQHDRRKAWTTEGRNVPYQVEWHPRRRIRWLGWPVRRKTTRSKKPARAKRVACLDLTVERAWQKEKRNVSLIVKVTERIINCHSQQLLLAEVGLQGWRSSLQAAPAQVIARHTQHKTDEQSNCEIKSDLCLERLPYGGPVLRAPEGFDCNDLIVHRGMFADNGQLGHIGKPAPVRHQAKRHRIKPILIVAQGTALQELMYRSAQFIRKARQRILDFGRTSPVVAVFRAAQEDVLTAGRSP